MAGAGAFLVDVEDEGVLVAVGADFADGLGVAGGGAFVPNFLAAAGEIDGFADFEGLAEGFLIHPGQHEGFLGFGIDGDSGEEAVGVEFWAEGEGLVGFFACWEGGEGDGVGCAHGGKSGMAAEECRVILFFELQGGGEAAAWGPMAVTVEKAFELIRGAHERQRLAHAFLISGPNGSGKQALAARIVQLVNPPEQEASASLFGEAEEPVAEKSLDELQGPYLNLVRPRSKSRQILINEVRELEREMHLTAPRDKWKVGVIIDADRMRDGPANAFLKTLEEPPPGCLLLLLTANPEFLLPTIRSRCVDLVLQPTGREDVLQPEAMRRFAKVLARSAKEPSEKNALLVKAAFESVLAERKAEIAEVNGASLKEEAAIYKKATEGSWMEEREKYYAALSEAEYQSARAALLDLLISWVGDAVRQRAGASVLSYPELKAETGVLAECRELDSLLAGLDALQELREMFNTNTQEGLAMEVGFMRAFA